MSGTQSQSAVPQHHRTPAEMLRALFRNSRPNVPAAQFYTAFLNALIAALRSTSACIWRANAETFQVVAQLDMDQIQLRPDTEVWARHQQLLSSVVRSGKPVRIPPGCATESGTNPLDLELFCVPFTAGNGIHFVIEVFTVVVPADPSRPPKGRLNLLTQLCEFFRDYVQSQELRMLADQAGVESALRTFVARLNSASTSRELAVVAVNEGRQAIGCDRISLGWMIGRHPQILSVTGHDAIDPRSNVIRALSNLTKAAHRSGLALQKCFPQLESNATHPPALDATERSRRDSDDTIDRAYQSALDSYPTTDRPRYLLVIPLGESTPRVKPRGALIVEQFQSDGLPNHSINRALLVADQVRLALSRVDLLESIPLLAWWSRSARGHWSRLLRRTWLMALVLGAAGGLASLSMELRLPANGELLAVTRHAVFAPESGIVREIHVDHGSRVHAGDSLLTIDNLELGGQLRELTGQLVQLRDRQRSLEAKRSGTRMSDHEQIELQSGLVEVATSVEHVGRQIQFFQERMDRLQIVAPADGIITSWNAKQILGNRTVQQGDVLLQEIDPAGRWMIELRIQEDRAGYVARHLSELPAGESIAVEFVLATEPQRRYPGRLRNIASRTEVTADGHIVRAVIELDSANLPPLRDGAEVKARLHCGTHRAGFVLFRELIEVIQTYWWY